MKKEIKGFIAGSLCASLCTAAVSHAAGWFESINVTRNSATISVDSVPINADNFIYNDTTYVPLRAVTEALGCSVFWDEEKREIAIDNLPLLKTFLATKAVSQLEVIYFTADAICEFPGDYIDAVGYILHDTYTYDNQKRYEQKLETLKNYITMCYDSYNSNDTWYLKNMMENNELESVSPDTVTNILESFNKQYEELNTALNEIKSMYPYSPSPEWTQRSNSFYSRLDDIQQRCLDITTEIVDLRNALFSYIYSQYLHEQ